eukprot:scaffold515265_cov37-Prasinocladus_malaysianus.AAC.1
MERTTRYEGTVHSHREDDISHYEQGISKTNPQHALVRIRPEYARVAHFVSDARVRPRAACINT